MIIVLIIIGWLVCSALSLLLFSKSAGKKFNLDQDDYCLLMFLSLIGGPFFLLIAVIYFVSYFAVYCVNWKTIIERFRK